MALSALLRNFYAPSARDREALLGVQTPVATTAEQPIAHFASSLDEGKTAEKQRKAEGMFRMAKRNVSHLRHKPLESLYALNQRFRGIVCFQGLNCLFVSRFSRMRRLDQQASGSRRRICWTSGRGRGGELKRPRRVFEEALFALGPRRPRRGFGD
jgi:hypothetical protein